MSSSIAKTLLEYNPACLCRMDPRLIHAVASEESRGQIVLSACVFVLIGTACYGAVFGSWHSARQACYASLKMPVLVFSVVLASALINGMLAQLLGSGFSFRQTGTCILLSLAISSTLLGALSPIVFFFVSQISTAAVYSQLSVYRLLLVMHTSIIGICGIVGNVRLYRLLRVLTNSTRVSRRVLGSWILVSGFVGCELSWIISPFLARRDIPLPFFNPNAFETNFYEYLSRTLLEVL